MDIIPMVWDSDFFHLRIAKAVVVSNEDVTELSKQYGTLRNRFDLIYIFSEPRLEMPLSNACLVDKKAVFELDIPTHFDADTSIECWQSKETPEPLISLALVSGKFSRFKVDTRFPAGSYERLYTQWIKQSVNKSIATEVFCYMQEMCPIGLLTLDRREERSIIGLVAVDEGFQNRGIGSALVNHAISFVHEHNGGCLSVTTQLNNEPACLLYLKCGFHLSSVKWVWHWWL